jgi:hypothetical protein
LRYDCGCELSSMSCSRSPSDILKQLGDSQRCRLEHKGTSY